MHRARFAALLILLATLCAQDGLAHAADPSAGETLARRWCAACHVVAADQARATEVATFFEIARTRNVEPDNLALMLARPHPAMPQVSLTRVALEELSAYLETLKPR